MIRALCMMILLLAGCGKHKPKVEQFKQLPIPVSSIQVQEENVSKTLRVLGKVEAADSVIVYSKVNGKLVDYALKAGSEVKKGDLIADIDRDEIGYKYNHAPIYSPISGIISSLPLAKGSEVRLDVPIATIMNTDYVKTIFSLPEHYRSQVKIGQKVNVYIDSLHEKYYESEVYDINPLIDPTSHSFTIEARIDNPKNELIPGLFASGDIVLQTFPDSILLPEEAIIPYQGQWHVYKVVEGQALLEKVKLGLRKLGKVQILQGVEAGDVVIVGGNHKVINGQKVKNV